MTGGHLWKYYYPLVALCNPHLLPNVNWILVFISFSLLLLSFFSFPLLFFFLFFPLSFFLLKVIFPQSRPSFPGSLHVAPTCSLFRQSRSNHIFVLIYRNYFVQICFHALWLKSQTLEKNQGLCLNTWVDCGKSWLWLVLGFKCHLIQSVYVAESAHIKSGCKYRLQWLNFVFNPHIQKETFYLFKMKKVTLIFLAILVLTSKL